MIDATPRADPARPTMGFVELVAFLAIIMALNALAIDVVLPGLPALGAGLGGAGGNQRQVVIVDYLIGMGASELVCKRTWHLPIVKDEFRPPSCAA